MEVLGLLRSKAVFCISTKFLCFCFNYLSKSALQKKKKKIKYLTGVLGLPMNLRGDRIFGSKENFSFTLSSTDGATYVKPCKTGKRHCNSQARMHSGSPVHLGKSHCSREIIKRRVSVDRWTLTHSLKQTLGLQGVATPQLFLLRSQIQFNEFCTLNLMNFALWTGHCCLCMAVTAMPVQGSQCSSESECWHSTVGCCTKTMSAITKVFSKPSNLSKLLQDLGSVMRVCFKVLAVNRMDLAEMPPFPAANLPLHSPCSLTRKTWLALSLRVESSGLSTGVWRVNFESNWLTSSSDCFAKTKWLRVYITDINQMAQRWAVQPLDGVHSMGFWQSSAGGKPWSGVGILSLPLGGHYGHWHWEIKARGRGKNYGSKRNTN